MFQVDLKAFQKEESWGALKRFTRKKRQNEKKSVNNNGALCIEQFRSGSRWPHGWCIGPGRSGLKS